AQRLATLESVADMESLPVDEKASRKLPVITQDDDLDGLDGAANLTIIRV
ncbi:MAG: VapC toxin family PIN domain ribonuclease, partial [Mycobacterium sp.]